MCEQNESERIKQKRNFVITIKYREEKQKYEYIFISIEIAPREQ